MSLKDYFKTQYHIDIQNENLYIEALTHSSYANEHNMASYERLEFLGDAVIEYLMSNYLFNTTSFQEGVMTKKRAQAVREEALVIYAKKVNLQDMIMLGVGEEHTGGRNKDAIIADVFEAVFGAISLDLGLDTAKRVFDELVLPYVLEVVSIKDFKSILQELVQADKRSLVYEIISETGPAHDKTFKAVVLMENIKMGEGLGKSKKDAEQKAAEAALTKLAKK